jgi:hypothetical protein
MSVEQSRLAWEYPVSGLPSVKLVLLVLAWYADKDGRNAWPSVPTMARQTGLSPRAVQASLLYLKQASLIQVERPSRGTLPTGYRLTLPLKPVHHCTNSTPEAIAPLDQLPLQPMRATPAIIAPTPEAIAPNPSDQSISVSPNARAGDPDGPALRGIEAARAAARAKPPEPSPLWGRHPPPRRTPAPESNPLEIERRRREAADLVARLQRESANVPRGTLAQAAERQNFDASLDTAARVAISATRPAECAQNGNAADGPSDTLADVPSDVTTAKH